MLCCANWASCARTFWGELLLLTNWHRAGEPPVPNVCQNAMFFMPLGLALSEKQIPQIAKNKFPSLSAGRESFHPSASEIRYFPLFSHGKCEFGQSQRLHNEY
jgi:hypothetical protein